MTPKEHLIYDYLNSNHRGCGSAIHSKMLERTFNLSGRTLRYHINNLRKCGLPICSDDRGYWIGTNAQEINGTISRFRDYINEFCCVKAGLAYASIQMRRRPHKESIEITVKLN